MRELNNFIGRVGIDKVLHFFVGMAICLAMTLVFILQDAIVGWRCVGVPTIGLLVVGVLSVIKESLDGSFDWKDIAAALLGCVPVYIVTAFGVWMYMLSR